MYICIVLYSTISPTHRLCEQLVKMTKLREKINVSFHMHLGNEIAYSKFQNAIKVTWLCDWLNLLSTIVLTRLRSIWFRIAFISKGISFHKRTTLISWAIKIQIHAWLRPTKLETYEVFNIDILYVKLSYAFWLAIIALHRPWSSIPIIKIIGS